MQAVRVLTLSILASTLLAACETFHLEPPPEAEIERDLASAPPDSPIIALVNTIDSAVLLEEKAARRGYRLIDQRTLGGLDLVLLEFRPPAGIDRLSAIRELEALEPHATAGLNHSYDDGDPAREIEAPGPRLYADTMIEWPAAGCRAHLAVGMIDGAIDFTIDALSGADIVTADFTDAAGGGAMQHGTAIAELLVGDGRLAQARLYHAVAVTDDAAGGSAAGVSAIVRALDWMHSNDVRVVNISLAGPYNKILDRAVQRAASRGMVIIAAVGNDGSESPPRYPAAFDDVIAVTAVDSASEVYELAVRGTHVDFAAPGVDVFVPDAGGGAYLSGTSIAAPFVTASIASDDAVSELRQAAEVRRRLSRTAVDLGLAGRDPVYGDGLVRSAPACRANDDD